MAGLEWPAKRIAPRPQNATIVGRKFFGGFFGDFFGEFFGAFFGTFFGMGCAAANGHNLAIRKGKVVLWGEILKTQPNPPAKSMCSCCFRIPNIKTTASQEWHSECNQPPVRSPAPIFRMGLQCGLSCPHLTKHSDDAKATKMAGGFAISLRDWACRVELF